MLPSSLQGFSLPPLEWHARVREWYQTMRETQPVAYDKEHNYWLIFRHSDVQHVLNEHTIFSSVKKDNGRAAPPTILTMDPPRHGLMRALLNPTFSPQSVARMVPRMAAMTEELLAKVIPQGEMDLIADLAAPLPTMVVGELLGVPPEDSYALNEWTDALIAATSREAGEEEIAEPKYTAAAATREIQAYFSKVIEDHRRHPRKDLISDLIAARVEGEPLTEFEVFGFSFTMLLAGHIMTTNLLGNAMLCFFENPGVIEQLRREPALMPLAVEEVMRYLPPERGVGAGSNTELNSRVVMSDTEISGHLIRKGEVVNVSLGSANFDERVFHHAEQFDIHRESNRHLALGHGIHFCIGARLARVQAKIVLSLLLERLIDIQIKPGTRLEQVRSYVLLGARQIPLTFKPGTLLPSA